MVAEQLAFAQSEGAWKIDKDLTGGGISGHVAMDLCMKSAA
jgi:hypothetical protein